jgi:hypothetical protein
MRYIINLVNKRGMNKVKSIEATDIKSAQSKVEAKYPEWEVSRITPDEEQLDYYSLVKDLRKYNK